MPATDRLVRLHSVTDPTKAEMIKCLLNQSGIECAVDGEHQAGFTGVFQIGITVWERDYDRAKEIIDRTFKVGQ